VAKDPAFGNVVSLLQESNQFRKGLHLFAGGRCAVEIADQADSDAFLVCPVARRASAVCAGELSAPAVRRLNLAVAAVCAVADYEIVTHAVPAIILPVPFVDYGRVAFIGGGMMNYYS
jgi:hypothetical protein